MNEIHLMAVGSSPFIAEEIRSICQSFLGTDWDIQTQTTREIKTCEPDTFYLCAKTQEAAISRYIPEGRRFILDLYPTTIFFLAIAGIPRGETVYVFNNLLPYTKRLAQECRDLGIDGLCFVPVAYEEMEEAQVRQRLRKARYIIGVDRFVGPSVLQSPKYARELRKEVKIIAGKRTASVSTACRVVDAIVAHGYEAICKDVAILQEKGCHKGNACYSADIARAEKLIALIRYASVQAVMTQVRGEIGVGQIPAGSLSSERIGNGTDALIERLRTIDYLRRKLKQLIV